MRSHQGIRGDQRRLSFVRSLALLVASILVLASALPAGAQSGSRIRVVGRAVVEVAPNFAMVRVGVSSRAPTPTAALDQNSATARKIIDFAKTFGVQERDIQTDAVNLTQVFKNVRDPGGNTRQEPDGYAASNMVRVTLRDLPKLGAFMRQALDQGATNIGGVEFGTSEHEKASDEARAKAVENAVRQAQGLTEAAKVKLGRILEITSPAGMSEGGPVPVMAPARAQRMSVPVEAGALQMSAEVEIVWALE
jgi:uncharacterized protein